MIAEVVSAFAEVLATPSFIGLSAAGLLAGTMYGFAGFGAALLYLPIATIFLEPRAAIAAFMLTSLSSLVVIVPKAWPQTDKIVVAQMIAWAVLGTLVGLWILDNGPVDALRWAILGLAAVTLVALVSGWRRTGRATPATRGLVATSAGVAGGATGLAGPIFILFQMSSDDGAARHRANIACFLTMTSILTLPLMALRGMLGPEDIARGILLLPIYAVGNALGQRLFDPNREVLYRRLAYGMIGMAIVLGLPIWGR